MVVPSWMMIGSEAEVDAVDAVDAADVAAGAGAGAGDGVAMMGDGAGVGTVEGAWVGLALVVWWGAVTGWARRVCLKRSTAARTMRRRVIQRSGRLSFIGGAV